MPTVLGLRLAMARIATPGTAPNRVLRLALAGLGLALALRGWWLITGDGFLSVDLEIPLRAAARFASGGQAYLPSSFLVASGPGLPFLYPPYLLPFLVPLLALPQAVLLASWFAICLVTAGLACRRLAIPTKVVPLALLWPAFWEGIWHGNAEILIFAAFVMLFFERPRESPFHPVDRSIRPGSTVSALRDGLLAVAIAVIKPTEGWAWLNILRRHRSAAIGGALLVVVFILATLPLVGMDLWLDYAAQASRAANPQWIVFGLGPAGFISGWPTIAVTLVTLALAFFVPRRSAGAWLGLLTVIGAPTLRGYELIFLVPALLRIRREIALLVAVLDATLAVPAIWLAIVITAAAMVAGLRFPGLLEAPPMPLADPTSPLSPA